MIKERLRQNDGTSQATITLHKPLELEHMKVQGRHVAHDRVKEGPGRNFGLEKRPKGSSPMLPR